MDTNTTGESPHLDEPPAGHLQLKGSIYDFGTAALAKHLYQIGDEIAHRLQNCCERAEAEDRARRGEELRFYLHIIADTLKREDCATFKIGDKVYWSEPDGIFWDHPYRIAAIHNEPDKPVDNDTLITITNDVGDTFEVYRKELCKEGIRHVIRDAQLLITDDGLSVRTLSEVAENEVIGWSLDQVREEPEVIFTIANTLARLSRLGVNSLADHLDLSIRDDGSVF
jgi:hypothetical protein